MKYRVVSLICFYIAFASQALSQEIVFPYQNCNPFNENFTQRLAYDFSTTEAKFCFDCKKNKSPSNEVVQKISMVLEPAVIPKQCFLAMALRGNKIFSDEQYVFCEDKHSKNIKHYKRLCVNENYINMLMNVWNYMSKCFNHDSQRQKEIFHLINQESGGILNVKSGKRARCLGQVTIKYVKDINKRIKLRNKTGEKGREIKRFLNIYDEVMQRCPELEEKVLTNVNAITCQTTHDPYVCLFYSFADIEWNRRRIHEYLNATSNHMKGRAFTDAEKQSFKLPIKLNEMLVAKVRVNGKETNMVFWDDSDLYDKLTDPKTSIIPSSIQKVPLFRTQENIELMFNYWSHNGGLIYSYRRMTDMTKRLKQSLTKGCNKKSWEKRCFLREQIQSGNGLRTSSVLSVFEQDIFRHHPNKEQRRRTANYIRRILETNNQTFGFKLKSAQTNTMISYYINSVKFKKKGLKLKHEDALAFQENVSRLCPKIDILNDKKTEEEPMLLSEACLVSDQY